MKRSYKRIICLLLCVVMSFGFAACQKGEGKEQWQGEHIDHSTETSAYLMQNGATSYKVVVPENSPEVIGFAVGELVDLFAEATGFKMQTVTDRELGQGDKYISLGRTEQFSRSGLTAEEAALKSTGYIIRTVNENVYVCGGGDTGTLNGVYGLLGKLFGYEFFAKDCYALQTGVKEIRLMNYDIREVPDFEYNAAGYGYLINDVSLMRRLRMLDWVDLIGMVNGGNVHNSFNWIDPDVYKKSHPDWFSDRGDQLCYTAHGNADEYEMMVNAAVGTLQESVMNDPNLMRVTLSHQDTQTWCQCETCTASLKKYNANAATVVQFINRIMEKMEAWFEGDGAAYARDLQIYLLAYHQTNAAPVVYDEKTDTFRPVDDSVRMRDDVGVWFAETNGDYVIPFTEGLNKPFADNLRGWASLTDLLMFWDYSSNVTHYFAPYNSFDKMQINYQFARENKAFMMFDQASVQEKSAVTGWANLKVYLSSKLAWDVNADMEPLIDAFFENYFGPASEAMRTWFESYRVHAAYIQNKQNYGGSRSIFINALQTKFWPKPVLDGWMRDVDAALEAIQPLGESSEEYALYYDRITLERTSLLYLMVELYESLLTFERADAYKNMFYTDTNRLGMTHANESFDPENISQIYRKWGLV